MPFDLFHLSTLIVTERTHRLFSRSQLNTGRIKNASKNYALAYPFRIPAAVAMHIVRQQTQVIRVYT